LKVDFKESFLRDLKRVNDKTVKARVREVIHMVEQAEHLHSMGNLKKLKTGADCYRIRVGDYRMGLILESDTIIFVRFLHRKDLYRYFP
jgi:mRNA interferase RelE/StbE